ncbi:LuxR C-terminal-related transcriptional regulator [Nocardia sp. CDC159]|uniref:LuxR C-terminal-related transcriptional regulator n=1 Tax=Nocardia pulmonis TaxID=2951408 RepID=A0A9X2E3V9_9NOCA|nr:MULTISPECIES: LuxR C-terminal-related transcriptional regulator [Nocardia]MCM6773729.1 LuxR C-terminal-related transcriptional regulator [Nocardia pulmonis]MCM6786616.1 LuxR C-terminal-related transcriptional regulator [Nocardia sp. CDC159]
MARRVSGNLPAEVTSFVGRRDELATARRLLTSTRVLSLLGPGGVGKTRLSRQVGELVARGFPDGVWLVELADVRDPELVTLAVADALQLGDDTTAPLPRLLEFLAAKRLLLIVDNCEHLIEAVATLVERIVASTDRVRVLTTSREVLGIPGEQVMPVPPLPAVEPDSDALRLLVERASAANPDFARTPANHRTLTAICRRLDGIPLALELAALRFRVFTPEQILARLDNTMELLRAGPRTAPHRQRTIEGAIRWSYELCSPAEQRLWERFSAFAGGFDIDAAEAVCAPGGHVVDALTGLVDKSVLTLRYEGATARYSMLEPIRQFGHDRLTERGDAAVVRARHRDHYRALALRGQRAYGGEEDVAWFAELTREHANLRSALRFSLTDAPALAVETATALRPYWEHYRFLSEGYRWLTDALDRYPDPTPLRARGLSSAGSLAGLLSDRAAAGRLLDECVMLATELSADDILAEARLGAALIAFTDGDTAGALTRCDQAATLARECGRPTVEMDSLAFGFICATVLAQERATAIATEFLALTTRYGSHLLGGLALWAVGLDHWRRGNQDAAADYMGRAIEMLARFDRCVWLASAFEGMAWSDAARGEFERAARLMGAAQTLQRSTVRLAHAIIGTVGEKVREQVRNALGEQGFRASYDSGAALPLPAAIDYALGRTAAPANPPAPPRRIDTAALDVLTRREKDVARLIAVGHSNKRIAAELVISVRTAETHVEHILTKLGFTSRTQIAGWARDHGLLTPP